MLVGVGKVPGVVQIDFNILRERSPEAITKLRDAFTGPKAYGAIAVTGIPEYGERRMQAYRAGIDLALKDTEGRKRAAAVNNTYPGWSGTPGSETHPLQSSFLFNVKEELNGMPNAYFGKNIFPSKEYQQIWVEFAKPMHTAAMHVLHGLDELMKANATSKGFRWTADGRSLAVLGAEGPALAGRFICYDSAFTREDRLLDKKHLEPQVPTTSAVVDHTGDGLALMHTHSTPIKSSGVQSNLAAGHAGDGLASMRTHSTPVKSSGVQLNLAAGHAGDGLASMRTHSTPVKSSGVQASLAAGHAGDGLASMRTHSTPVKSSGVQSNLAAGHAGDGLASMRTHSTPVKSSGVQALNLADGHAGDAVSMPACSTPVQSPGALSDLAHLAQTESLGDVSEKLGGHMREHSRVKQVERGTQEDVGDYWLPWHIDSNFVTLIHKEMYAYEDDGSLVAEPRGAGVVFMNEDGDVAPLEVPDDALVFQFGGFGQIYTGGEIIACRHAVVSPRPRGIARFNFCNFWYAKWDTLCDAPPGTEHNAINTGWNAMMDESYLNISMKNGFAAFRKFMTSPETRLQFANSQRFLELAELVPLPPKQIWPTLQGNTGIAPKIIVDVLTDVRCPFSHLAKLNLNFAVNKSNLQDQIIFRYYPVFLNPRVPKEGECLDDYLLREYGFTREYAHSEEYPLHRAGRDVGVQFNPGRRVVNTFDAFCLLEVAEQKGLQTQALEELSQRYFEKAQDISDASILMAVAEAIGLQCSEEKLFSVETAASVAGKYVRLSQHVQEVPHFIIREVASGNGIEVNGTRSVTEWESILNSVVRKGEFIGMRIPGPQGHELFLSGANPTSPISLSFSAQHGWAPENWPYKDDDFARIDETDDSTMYSFPRFVTHLDDSSILALTDLYTAAFSTVEQGFSVLDLCSSWTSHFPQKQLNGARVVVHGMNDLELQRNRQATERHKQDLNLNPILPWEGNSFDFATIAMSVQYLTNPQVVFSELHRVLKLGGMAIISYSNRCFIEKAVKIWANEVYDGEGHAHIIRNYFLNNPKIGWTKLSSVDVSPKTGDPVWVVTAIKGS